MTRTNRPLRRLAVCSLAAILSVTACGGDDDESAPDTEASEDTTLDDTAAPVATAEPVATAAVEATTTAPPPTDPPVTDPPVTNPPATDPPVTDAVSAGPFCDAAEDFFLPGRALDFSDTNDPTVLKTVFRLLNAMAPVVIELAPTADDAALFVESKRLLDIATPGLEAVDYSLENPADIPDGAAVGQALIDFGDLLGDMQAFLIERCGSDRLALDEEAQQLAADIAAGIVTAPEPAESIIGPAGLRAGTIDGSHR